MTLTDGTLLASEMVVGTIGTQPNALLASLGLPRDGDRLKVTPELRVEGFETIWAVGDCACAWDGDKGKPYPATAQVAVQQGHQPAHNIAVALAGDPLSPFRYRHRSSMAAVGHLNSVAEVGGLPFHGFAAWLVWRAFYLMQMPTFSRKLRIFFEWAWGMFFPTDITHLRFTRSRDVMQPPLE